MQAIAGILDGISLGAPIARGPLTIVPILDEHTLFTSAVADDYIALEDAIASGAAAVTEVSTGGSVPEIAVKNDTEVAVFILDGEALIGAKQNRIVNLSILVPPKTVLPIPVSCVEHGRWSYRSAEFRTSPNTMAAGSRAAKSQRVNQSLKHGLRDAGQSEVWNEVAGYAAQLGVRSDTGAMEDVYTARSAHMEDMLAGLQPLDAQVGAAFALGGRVTGAELFESPRMFARYFGRLMRSYSLQSLVTRAKGHLKLGDVEQLLASVRAGAHNRYKAVGLGEDLRIEAPDLAGGALLLGQRVVHMAVFRPGAFA